VKRKKTVALLGALTVAVSLTAIACSTTKTYASQCAYIIQSGFLDAHHLKKILHPGEQTDSTNDTTKYVYCNARNYLVRPGGDHDGELSGRTKSNQDGTPGNPVKVQLSMYWTLNQTDEALKAFLPFCEKYTCFSSADTGGSARYSSPGWNGMLAENFAPALERALVQVLPKYDGNLPNEQSDWPKLAQDLSTQFMSQIKISDGSDALDFFCSSGSKEGTCDPVTIQVDHVEFANQQAQDLYNQSSTLDAEKALADKQKAVNDAQHRALTGKYGPYTYYFQGLQDTIAKCHDSGQNCTIILGNGGSPQIQVPTK
jgi:hypothetical protein